MKGSSNYQRANNFELVIAMCRNDAWIEDYTRCHRARRWYDAADAIIELDDIDAVYIASLANSYCDYVCRRATAGKAVYVEKSIALSYAQRRTMVDPCGHLGLPLFIVYYRRALPYLIKVHVLLACGSIGSLTAVIAHDYARVSVGLNQIRVLTWRIDLGFSGVGFFFETACYTFNAFDFLFGPIEVTGGMAKNFAGGYAVEDTVADTFNCANLILGAGFCCFATDRDFEVVEGVASDGILTFHPYTFAPIFVTLGGMADFHNSANSLHIKQPLIQTNFGELSDGAHCPSADESGSRTNLIIEKMLQQGRPRQAAGAFGIR